MSMNNFSEKVSFIWGVADLLRGDYKPSEYGRVILPFILLRRLDQVLALTREAVWNTDGAGDKLPAALRERMLMKSAACGFYNLDRLDFPKVLQDPDNIAANLTRFLHGFSANVRDILERFRFETQIARLDHANLLFLVARRFIELDLHPYRRHPDGSLLLGPDGQPEPNVTNHEMGSIFEELIRRFSEQSNETAGEHFTPREVIAFMVNLLFAEDDEALQQPGLVRTLYDPACGTGGMLSVAEDHLGRLNPQARLEVFGQELNDESYAICKADMLVKGQAADNIKCGNSFSADALPDLKADYLISNPPFGVDWSKAEKAVKDEHETQGHGGRFGPGLPRKNDGSLLFLLHMLSKMKRPHQGGSRLAIVFNGSPLFTGAAASGESEIRRWIIENDWLEAIVALPDQMFYNTGISTYVWLLTNRKAPARRGKVQLINGVNRFRKMRKSLGDKRKELGPDDIDTLTRLYADFTAGPEVKVFDNADFGFHRITVERPLRLNFQASPERIERLKEEKTWQALLTSKKKGGGAAAEILEGEATQRAVLDLLKTLAAPLDRTSAAPSTEPTAPLYKNRDVFTKSLKSAARTRGLKLAAPVLKAILSALSERDESADVCTDNGQPEPDPDLRDYENVPLKDDIGAYLEREVLPHVPDAWVDHSKTKIGYEIPFTRHFYVYQAPRPLAVIRSEIEALESEIQGLLGRVLG
ncbi:type I restriction-modification system subunit M [Candidatus Thiodictyon syntrophicum]|nr:class I SAM-dependent DNA methyltransferase [Candidatus Thiodictyon syntrophicum]